MKERVAALVGGRASAMWVSTFHSACVRILRREAKRLGPTRSFSIYDAADSQRLMALVCRELDLDPKRSRRASFAAQVCNLKNELVDAETFAAQRRQPPERTLAEAYTRYQRRLREANALRLRRPDHDDGAPAAGVPRRRGALPAPVPARARRRVPGHQPRAVRAGPRAGRGAGGREPRACRRPSCASSATPTSRSTRSAARRSATSSSSRTTTRTPDDPARAELPLHPDDPLARPTR